MKPDWLADEPPADLEIVMGINVDGEVTLYTRQDFTAPQIAEILREAARSFDSGEATRDQVQEFHGPARTPTENEDGTWAFGDAILRNVHSPEQCEGQSACVIHKPTTHRMRNWPLIWRQDSLVFMRVCAHGDQHPDPDQVPYWESLPSVHWRKRNLEHKCDGCCRG